MASPITAAMAKTAAQRFWAKVCIGPDCWEWTGARTSWGYGSIGVKCDSTIRTVGAHRLSYLLHHGEIPGGLFVRHTCDNPSCVNPQHLLLGTHAENVADKVRRGRLPNQRGERNPYNKLREAEVRQIRAILSEPNPPTQKDLAAQFGVRRTTIGSIKQGKNWTHVA